MAVNFQTVARSGRTVADIVFGPIDAVPLVVDVGARNGMVELPQAYAARADYLGFEPNKDECEKLSGHRTDAHLAGVPIAKFRSEHFEPAAVWGSGGNRTLLITRSKGSCTLKGHANEAVARNLFLDGDGSVCLMDRALTVVGEDEVPCRTLDEIVTERPIDYLKIDVEGGEIDVLNGADNLFRTQSVFCLRTEFQMVPYYHDHALLGDQHAYLAKHKMRLIDLDFAHARYQRVPTTIPGRCDRRPIFAGDAFFIPDPDLCDLSPQTRQRIAAVLLSLGFNSLGVGLLREAALCSREDIAEIEAALCHVSLRARLKQIWTSFPATVARVVDRLGN